MVILIVGFIVIHFSNGFFLQMWKVCRLVIQRIAKLPLHDSQYDISFPIKYLSKHAKCNVSFVLFSESPLANWGHVTQMNKLWCNLELYASILSNEKGFFLNMLSNGKSMLGQVMAWCRLVIIHYLSQFWPESISTNVIIKPQWVNVNKVDTSTFRYIPLNT